MGLFKHSENRNAYAHINFQEGVIFSGKKDARETYNGVSGVPTQLDTEVGEYNGEPTLQAKFKLEDKSAADQSVILTFNAHSFRGGQLLGCLYRAVVEHPGATVKLIAWKFEKGDRLGDGKIVDNDMSGVSVRVGNARIKPLYVDGAESLPEAPKKKIGKKTVLDMEPVEKAIDALIVQLQASLLGEVAPSDDDIPF